jgi:hypothetical protein
MSAPTYAVAADAYGDIALWRWSDRDDEFSVFVVYKHDLDRRDTMLWPTLVRELVTDVRR